MGEQSKAERFADEALERTGGGVHDDEQMNEAMNAAMTPSSPEVIERVRHKNDERKADGYVYSQHTCDDIEALLAALSPDNAEQK
jgi:hypothetical protein